MTVTGDTGLGYSKGAAFVGFLCTCVHKLDNNKSNHIDDLECYICIHGCEGTPTLLHL